MKYKWILPTSSSHPGLQHDFHPVLLSVLEQRGFKTPSEINNYLDKSLQGLHDPGDMKHIDRAVTRILEAVERREKIMIYGDYDVDGITGIAILTQFFRLLKIPTSFYVPHRVHEGYGLSAEGIRKAHENGIKLIITVDTGINNHAEILAARQHGINVIVTDHHKAPDRLPDAAAVVNPNQPDCPYPNKHLSGAGVAFKLVHACLRKCSLDEKTCKRFLKNLLDYVTLGTIADLVSLTGENRRMVASGLKQIPSSPFPGIRVILDQLAINHKSLSAGMIAFRVTPKLNASGRVDHGRYSAKLLIEENPAECRHLFSKLELCNRERQCIEESDLDTAVRLIEDDPALLNNRILVVSHPNFHPGVNGIIASRLVEKFHLPSIVLAPDNNGCLKGSARSIRGFNMFECIESCADLCRSFGGHTFAAGMTLDSSKLDAFKSRIYEFMRSNGSRTDFEPTLSIDACLNLPDISAGFIHDLKLMEPFGLGNTEPLFLTRNAVVQNDLRVLKGKHVKFNLRQGKTSFEVIGFNQSKRIAPHVKPNDRVDLVYRVGINTWLGQEKVQLELIDLRKN